MTISRCALPCFLLVVGLLTWCAFEYQGNQLVAARADLADATADLHTEREAARLARDQLAARDQLDTHHTEELNRARAQINTLQLAVADGSYRLRIKAFCPAMPVPPAPPAWLMQAAPNSQQTLDRIISPSETSLPSAGK